MFPASTLLQNNPVFTAQFPVTIAGTALFVTFHYNKQKTRLYL